MKTMCLLSMQENASLPKPWGSATQNDLVGRRLNHADYGSGTIIAVDGSGEDQKITVEFRNRQQRKFLFRYVASYVE